MPTIRISEANFHRLQQWAEPLADSVDDALSKALTVAESYRPDPKEPENPSTGLNDEPRLPEN